MHSHTMTKNEPTFGMNSQKISSLLSLPVASPSPSTSPSKNKKKSSSLPPETVEYLKAWMMSPEHIQHPYPTEQEKSTIMEDTSIELKQLTNWFVNNRKRFWKPRVEASLNQSSPVSAKVPKTTKSTDALVKHKRLHSSSISLSSYSSGSASPTISHDNDHSFMEQSVAGTADLMRMTTVFATAPTTVSEHSTLVSDSGSVASHEQDDLSTGEATEEAAITKTESVSVHILRPVGNLMPTLEDVTILANIPAERIIHSYDSCVLNYKLSSDSATLRKKIQSRRDSEVARIEKQYLKVYLTEPSACLMSKRSRSVWNHDDDEEEVQTPRQKYQRASVDLWKEVCLSTINGYDRELPSLEEASQLFGFSN